MEYNKGTSNEDLTNISLTTTIIKECREERIKLIGTIPISIAENEIETETTESCFTD